MDRRRKRVLQLIADGMSPSEIADEIGVSPSVVREDRRVLRERGHEIEDLHVRAATDARRRRDSVRDLVAEGLTPAQIAQRCAVPSSTVHADISTPRKQGHEIPRYRSGTSWVDGKARVIATVDPNAKGSLDRQADTRGMTTRELASAVLAAVAGRDRVLDALLSGGRDG